MSENELNRKAVNDKLKALARQFRVDTQLQLALVTTYCQGVATGRSTPEQMTYCYRTLHRIAGAGGTFGCPELGSLARALEQQLKPAAEGYCLYNKPINGEFLATLEHMKSLLEAPNVP